MSREAFWSMVLFIGGGLMLAGIQLLRSEPVGAAYVRPTVCSFELPATADVPAARTSWTIESGVSAAEANESGNRLSVSRTLGLWFAALLTLAVFSFLAGDNPAFKLAESIFVGVSAGYAMVVGFWEQIVPNLIGRLMPTFALKAGIANLDGAVTEPQWTYLVPLVMGVMMLWQLASAGGWIARWPLAFFIGATAGIRITATFEADFLRQIQNTMLPFLVIVFERGTASNSLDWIASVQQSTRNILVVLGVLTSLTYFFFSLEHRGVVGVASRVGIYVLMITFGAGFAYTVMGRIVLLTQRFEFLFFDWLHFPVPG